MNEANPNPEAVRKALGRVHLTTLGCKVNQYETQFVKELLEQHGWLEASQATDADLCIVNTCTVTHEGDAKSRQTIRRLHQSNPTASILVMGCYATRDPDTVASLPGVSQVVTDKNRLEEELAPLGVTGSIMGISRFDDHQRAFVKVQDGCLLNCSYCIIPTIRPVVRSRPISEIVTEVNRLADSGYEEMVLTGIHLGHYGIDLSKGKPKSEWSRLWHLLEKLTGLPDRFRVRLSSLEAAEARDDLIRVMNDQPRICPHLHLCLQSGSDRILTGMKRRYRQHGFLERIARIRQILDEPAITTDVIVGFPGESEADFAETCKVVREAEISRIHVFSYSPREGTEAARLPDDVPATVKAARRRILEDLGREMAERYQRRLIGRELEVLVEGVDPQRPGYARGTSCRFVPMSFPGQGDNLKKRRVRVRALRVDDGILIGDAGTSSWSEAMPRSVPSVRRGLPIIDGVA